MKSVREKYRIEVKSQVEAKDYGGPAGYHFKYSDPKKYTFSIWAFSPENKEVGTFSFWYTDDGEFIQVQSAGVAAPHRRKRLTTAAYVLAEKITGKKILVDDVPGSMNSDAKALWSQPNRPFGVLTR